MSSQLLTGATYLADELPFRRKASTTVRQLEMWNFGHVIVQFIYHSELQYCRVRYTNIECQSVRACVGSVFTDPQWAIEWRLFSILKWAPTCSKKLTGKRIWFSQKLTIHYHSKCELSVQLLAPYIFRRFSDTLQNNIITERRRSLGLLEVPRAFVVTRPSVSLSVRRS